jgi:hypothetical protein
MPRTGEVEGRGTRKFPLESQNEITILYLENPPLSHTMLAEYVEACRDAASPLVSGIFVLEVIAAQADRKFCSKIFMIAD